MSTHDGTEFSGAADPFTALRASDLRTPEPLAPDSEFARSLRDRLERGATLPRGVVMSSTTIETRETDTPVGASTSPDTATEVVERPGALPYLTVAGARDAIDWYVASLGARLRGEPIVMDDDRIGHAELEIGGGVIYIADEFADIGLTGPAPGHVSVSLMLPVADTDSALETARRGGATIQREPYEGYGTRGATIIDPFGHRWMLTGPSATPPPSTVRAGDVGYMSLNTPDVERAVAFYGAVLGWEYDEATRRVTNVGHPLGVVESDGPGTLFGAYAVDDLDAARERIVAAGGRAEQAVTRNGRTVLDAVDDAGVAFAVYVPDPGDARLDQHPSGVGEMSYLTVSTRDSERFRRFYGSVLGWEFTAGRMADGWEADDVHPQVGIAGGADREVAVPMWNVADIDAAVQRVRDAGGRVITDPDPQPYGIMALCADDQETEFYLGQLF
ncbi:VOC family protein [Gordonia soli]|uniref:VOC domain-containing protein n=1 Tax=Gordonia soli NBRC 108243 TaxID=1223545 RepID=M0QRZ3_9ACTN|nr:VOC family protein [Gordonia soli]GAC70547.1 hypothetical protein GS4_36_00330 [Gordonia soli NBRC 108243]